MDARQSQISVHAMTNEVVDRLVRSHDELFVDDDETTAARDGPEEAGHRAVERQRREQAEPHGLVAVELQAARERVRQLFVRHGDRLRSAGGARCEDHIGVAQRHVRVELEMHALVGDVLGAQCAVEIE